MKVKAFVLVLVLSLTAVACEKDVMPVLNLNGNKITIIGHGGSGFYTESNSFPENSYSAVVRAIKGYKADGVEIDIQITKDGSLALYHDALLEKSTTCYGCLTENDAADVYQCAYKQSAAIGGDKIIPFTTILDEFAGYSPHPILFLDTKPSCGNEVEQDFETRFTREICNTVEKYNVADFVIVECGSLSFGDKMYSINPSIKLIYRVGEISEELLKTLSQRNYYGIISSDDITAENVALAHQYNLRVTIYNVRVKEDIIENIAKQPDYIQSDNIPLLQKLLN